MKNRYGTEIVKVDGHEVTFICQGCKKEITRAYDRPKCAIANIKFCCWSCGMGFRDAHDNRPKIEYRDTPATPYELAHAYTSYAGTTIIEEDAKSLTFICQYCGRVVTRWGLRANTRKQIQYCSKECAGAASYERAVKRPRKKIYSQCPSRNDRMNPLDMNPEQLAEYRKKLHEEMEKERRENGFYDGLCKSNADI